MIDRLAALPAWVHWAALCAAAALGAVAARFIDPALWRWQPELAVSQPWRMVTAAWVHLSHQHLIANLAGTAWRYHDPTGIPSVRLNSLVFREKPLSGTYAVRGLITKLDLSSVNTNVRRITLRVKVGSTTFESDLDCTEKPSGTATTCSF